MIRRGFTMLEVVLAAVIGSMIVLACLAVFSSLDNVDRALDKKFDETNEMANLHLVMQRTFSTLVMSDQNPPRITRPGDGTGTTGPAGTARPTTGPTTSGSGTSSGSSTSSGSGTWSGSGSSSTTLSSTPGSEKTSTGSTASSAASAPRTSSSSSTTPATEAAGEEKTPVGRFIIAPSPLAPIALGRAPRQRLEVVVNKAPVNDPRAASLPPVTVTTTTKKTITDSKATSTTAVKSDTPGKETKSTGSATSTGAASTGATATGDQKGTEGAPRTTTVETTSTGVPDGVRGFFELVSEASLPNYRPGALASSRPTAPLALVWNPIPPANATSLSLAAAAMPPVVVVRGLEVCNWKVFDDRERKSEYSALWYNQLPAYVEMEVRTTGGLYANWLFEVEWTQGPEPGEPPAIAAGGGPRGGGGGQRGGGPGGEGRGRDLEQAGRGLQGGPREGMQRIRREGGPDGQLGQPGQPGQRFRERRLREGQQPGGPQDLRRDDRTPQQPPADAPRQPPRTTPRRRQPQP